MGMQLTPNEIDSIEQVGTLSGHPVRMIRTKGGFFIAVSRKKGNAEEEAIGAGSHPAIVRYNLEKQFSEYVPNMMKSEGFADPIVDKHSHYLSEELRKSGHDIFSIQTGPAVEFKITKYNAQVAKVDCSLESDHLLIHELSIPKKFASALAGAATEKACSIGLGLKLRK
jgi:hypothetical protein